LDKYRYDLIHSQLVDIVGESNVVVREIDRTIYSIGRNWLARTWMAQGFPVPKADFIVHPTSEVEVQKILILANKENTPVVPFGGGSSGMGGNLPFYGGIILDIKKMNKIREIDDKSLTTTVESGVNCWKLEDELNRLGYTSGHIPASFFCSCIGGYIACRSAGRLSTKYGKMEDMILALRVVLPTGEIFHTMPAPGKATGPELNHLFIGCEGTLGVVTEAVMKIHNMPEERRFRGILFPDVHSGIEAMRKIMQNDIVPCLARLYDEEETSTRIRDTWGITGSGAFLVIGFDGLRKMVDLQESMALDICKEEGGKDLGSEPGERWWEHKYDDYYPTPKSVKEYRALLGGKEIGATSDTCTTYDKIEDLYLAMRHTFWEKFGKKYKGWFYGHFSHWYKNGVMLYPRWHLYEVPKEENIIEIYWKVWSTMVRVALEHGGVLNHHHGIGTVLGRFMPEQYGDGFQVLKEIKRSLDPRNILNPGVLGLGGR